MRGDYHPVERDVKDDENDTATRSVLRRLLLHVIDDYDGHRVLLQFQLESELFFNGLENSEAAIRVRYRCCAARLLGRVRRPSIAG